MERIEFTVHGERVSELPRAIGGYPEDKRVDYDGNGVYVVATEKYYLRTNSNLQATTIFDLVDETTCVVAVLSGGGGSGLLQRDLGTESAESRRLVRKIEDFCASNGLEVERE